MDTQHVVLLTRLSRHVLFAESALAVLSAHVKSPNVHTEIPDLAERW